MLSAPPRVNVQEDVVMEEGETAGVPASTIPEPAIANDVRIDDGSTRSQLEPGTQG